MKHLSLKRILLVLIVFLNIKYVNAQRIYAGNNATSASGLLCLGCTVTNPSNAADGNTETFSILNVAVGLAAQTNEDLIFTGAKPAAGTPVTVKLGSGDKLLS